MLEKITSDTPFEKIVGREIRRDGMTLTVGGVVSNTNGDVYVRERMPGISGWLLRTKEGMFGEWWFVEKEKTQADIRGESRLES